MLYLTYYFRSKGPFIFARFRIELYYSVQNLNGFATLKVGLQETQFIAKLYFSRQILIAVRLSQNGAICVYHTGSCVNSRMDTPVFLFVFTSDQQPLASKTHLVSKMASGLI